MNDICSFSVQLYTEDDETGEIRMALSSDSTCSSELTSPEEGYETMILRPRPQPAWPDHLISRVAATPTGQPCSLPEWAQGKWQHVHIQGGSLILRDQRDFKTYTALCVESHGVEIVPELEIIGARHKKEISDDAKLAGNSVLLHSTPIPAEAQEERFLIYTRTQCGDEHYKCVWLKNRGSNAMEFQLGKSSSQARGVARALLNVRIRHVTPGGDFTRGRIRRGIRVIDGPQVAAGENFA